MSQLWDQEEGQPSPSHGRSKLSSAEIEEDTKKEIEAHQRALQSHEDENKRKRRGMCLRSSRAEEINEQIRNTLPNISSLTLLESPDTEVTDVPINYSTIDCPFECKPSHQKGLGLFATRPIAAGHLIFRETALLCCSDHALEKSATYLALSDENKVVLGNLQNSCKCGTRGRATQDCDESRLTHLWATNAFTMPSLINHPVFETAGMPLAGLYALASRLNHSCQPNVYYGFTREGELRVWAKKDIETGQEILRSYLSNSGWEALPNRGLRWFKLGFDCLCNVCVTFPHLPMQTAETAAAEQYYHDVRKVLGDSLEATNCPLFNRTSDEETERFVKAERWVTGVQEDLMRRFEEFKLGSAFCMVVGEMPPSIVITAMLVELIDRDWTVWSVRHLKYLIGTGPGLPRKVLIRYMDNLAGYINKSHNDLQALFMSALPEIASDLKDYEVPKTEEDKVDKVRMAEELKEILGITLVDGSAWETCEEEEEAEVLPQEPCDHPDCMEHVENKTGML